VRSTGIFYEADVLVALELIDLGLTPDAGGYLFTVAEWESRAAGYACFGLNPMTDTVYDLYWIAVDRALQGQGIGRQILTEVEARVRELGGRMLMIETGGKASYAPTRAFYLACDYREVARVPDYYRVGDDKVMFAKVLKQDRP
jgi:GNAT superfamily N-acetyltransferase